MTIKSFLVCGSLACCLLACSQQEKQEEPLHALPMETLSLDNLAAFKTTGNNWRIAGNVYTSRQQQQDMQAEEGKGILLYQPQEAGTTELFTQLLHGDIDLETDFMLSPGASATILLQGRYPLHLNDSWLKDSLTATDCGGLAQQAPLMNTCKAPGLWQHLEVKFRAPRFDASGKKISNAAFNIVRLNGRPVQQQVLLAGPAQNGVSQADTVLGPLLFRGGKRPVAFRNIRYKTYGSEKVALTDMRYSIYKGVYKNHDTLQYFSPVRTGITDSLSCQTADKRAQFLVNGKLQAPEQGDYLFKLRAGGPVRLRINGTEIANNKGTRNYEDAYYGKVTLDKGAHDFELSYANYDESLVLEYEGPHIPFTTLSTEASERKVPSTPPMELAVKGTAVVQRGFLQHAGSTDPYSMAVGIPGGYNYAYDMVNYSPLCAWHGAFLNVAEMWHERGEKQLEEPLGAPLDLSGLPVVAMLAKPADAWPGAMQPDSSRYNNRGYRLLPDGRPVFFYTLGELQIEDQLYPAPDGKGLQRDITVKCKQPVSNAYCLLADGKLIEKLPDGSYAVDDKRYYIATDLKPEILRSKDQYRLQLPLSGSNDIHVNYTIIW